MKTDNSSARITQHLRRLADGQPPGTRLPSVRALMAELRVSPVPVQQALDGLPPEYREPLVLCDLEEMGAREAAELLKISVPALKSRLYRGRRALRDKLGTQFERTYGQRLPS